MRLCCLLVFAFYLLPLSFCAQTDQLVLTICEENPKKRGRCGVRVVPAAVFDNRSGGIDEIAADTSNQFLLTERGEERIVRFTHNGQNYRYWLPEEARRVTVILNRAARPGCVTYLTWNSNHAIELGPYFSSGCGERNRVEINGSVAKSRVVVNPGVPSYRLLDYHGFLAGKRKAQSLINDAFPELGPSFKGSDFPETHFIRQRLLPEETAFIYRDGIVKKKKRVNNEYQVIAWVYYAVCLNERVRTARLVSARVYDVKNGKRKDSIEEQTESVRYSSRKLDYDKVARAFALIDAAGFGGLDNGELTKMSGPVDANGLQPILSISHVVNEEVYLKVGLKYRAYHAYAPEIFISKWPGINRERKVFVKSRNLMRSFK